MPQRDPGVYLEDIEYYADAAIGFDAAASLGCRFATSFRALVDQGRVRAGEWLAIHGCGCHPPTSSAAASA